MGREPKPAPAALVDETKPYPDTGPLAVFARVALILCIAAVVYATIAPGSRVPKLLYSNNLEHFAAFYVAAMVAAAAFPRRKLRHLTIAFALLSLALEVPRLGLHHPAAALEKWSADFGGVLAAYLPMTFERFRRLFPQRSA